MTQNTKIAFQGTLGANSHILCNQFYPGIKTVPCQTFHEVFDFVANGDVNMGVIPIENSYSGRVSEIHNLLQESNVSIIAEHFLKIDHKLAGIKGAKIEDIKEVYSHQQALMQCRLNLAKTKIKQYSYINTAKAAEMIAKTGDKSKAAICSQLAADVNNLEVIKHDMQDSKDDNFTIFITIANNGIDPDPKKGKIITTILFTVRNIPGSLYKVLGSFATNNVNLIKLESYIPGGFSKQAKFFASIEGHPDERNVALALEELGFFSKSTKVLGIYYADNHRFLEK